MSELPERPPQRRGGRMRGAEGYHKEDIDALLRCTRLIVPTTAEEWDQVLDEYRRTHASVKARALRDANSLKVKFKQLARGFKAGRDARPEIQEAGAILELIDAKMTSGKWLQRRGGRARGAEGFSTADAEAVLKAVQHVLPVYRSDWERAAEEYNRVYALPNDRSTRDGVSLKNKFRNWLKDNGEMPRAEVTEALAVQAEIDAKIKQMGKNAAALETLPATVNDVDPTSAGEYDTVDKEDGNEHDTTSGEGAEKTATTDNRRGGRALGSEGYTLLDTRALLACVKQVLPAGPSSWEQVLQLYRTNHAIPEKRSLRSLTGVKSKFRQLIYFKEDTGTGAPEEVVEARAIQREIELGLKFGKRPRSEDESTSSFSHTPDPSTPESPKDKSLLLPRPEARNNENLERHNVTDLAGLPANSVPVDKPSEKRYKQGSEGDTLRDEIASRELELLKQREFREAEQAAWDKERSVREKQRMDLEAWTFVCDRIRALYREQATESNPQIASVIDEEIAVLKKKKQRLASVMM
ncbi:unnamed protein product [Phytophthora lilii]|uniref:Unnamed protein product n=1 Tax=Phytophthora lilii TaxID=2077276 RepID=A0A9W6TZH7_9STRA|nr:unnamed protein product [Phytophthora lilii]